jgi:thiamine-phosphate pyrophosphorylase
MPHRHPVKIVPTVWLMTDERLGDDLWAALSRLPRGGGVVFRHYATPLAERRALYRRVARIARRRGLVMIRAGDVRLGAEDGVHARRAPGLVTWPVHSRGEAVHAVRAGAHAVFVSPVFATRSHPGARSLGPMAAARIVRGLPVVAIALGGMTRARARSTMQLGFSGWAAIDAWSGADQKRKAVPM